MSREKSFTLILRQAQDNVKDERSFTLIELLIVIGILAVLAVVVVLVLNPTELLKQSRDSVRLSDLATLNKAIGIYQAQGQTALGTLSTVYVSVPDSSATCANLGLPSLPSGWAYACVASSTLKNVDGTGWVPVNLTLSAGGSPLGTLPIDPINTTSAGNYYTYVTGGSWELTAMFESNKDAYINAAINDGDSYPGVYSLRTSNTVLTPGIRDKGLVGYWKLDEGSGTTAADSSGSSNTGTWNGTGSHWTTGKVGGYAGQFNGTDDYVQMASGTNYSSTQSHTYVAWIKLSSLPTASYTWVINNGGGSTGTSLVFMHAYSDVFGIFLAGGSNPYPANTALTANTWYHIAVSYNGSTNQATFYLNGANDRQTTITGVSWASDTTPVRIGAWFDGSNKFPGIIDDTRIYNRVLSAAEIQAIYNATK